MSWYSYVANLHYEHYEEIVICDTKIISDAHHCIAIAIMTCSACILTLNNCSSACIIFETAFKLFEAGYNVTQY